MESSQTPTNGKESDVSFLDKAKQVAEELVEKPRGPDGARRPSRAVAEKAKPLAEKAAPYAEKAADLAVKGVSSAASTMDKATGGKYHDRIENVSGKVTERAQPRRPARTSREVAQV